MKMEYGYRCDCCSELEVHPYYNAGVFVFHATEMLISEKKLPEQKNNELANHDQQIALQDVGCQLAKMTNRVVCMPLILF
jgi:mannose-1-phosphate guanylyltransferase